MEITKTFQGKMLPEHRNNMKTALMRTEKGLFGGCLKLFLFLQETNPGIAMNSYKSFIQQLYFFITTFVVRNYNIYCMNNNMQENISSSQCRD